jgi:hypothetical protein
MKKIRGDKPRTQTKTNVCEDSGFAPVGGGRWWGKSVGGKIQYKKCVHIYVNAKTIPIETIL